MGDCSTCLTSIGVLISGTFASMYLDNEATSMGWRTSPAIISSLCFQECEGICVFQPPDVHTDFIFWGESP